MEVFCVLPFASLFDCEGQPALRGYTVEKLSMNLLLTQATRNDLDWLVDIRIEAMKESLVQVGRFDPARARARFVESFEAEYTQIINVNEQAVGFVVVRPIPQKLHVNKTDPTNAAVLLDHLYVHPAHQGQGIGSAVLSIIFKDADEQGKAMRVGALRESASNRFYARHGFELVEQAEWDNYYLRPPRSSSPGSA